jgi:hypothetical protein
MFKVELSISVSRHMLLKRAIKSTQKRWMDGSVCDDYKKVIGYKRTGATSSRLIRREMDF